MNTFQPENIDQFQNFREKLVFLFALAWTSPLYLWPKILWHLPFKDAVLTTFIIGDQGDHREAVLHRIMRMLNHACKSVIPKWSPHFLTQLCIYVYIYIGIHVYIYICVGILAIGYNWLWHIEPIEQLICTGRYLCSMYYCMYRQGDMYSSFIAIDPKVQGVSSPGSRSITIPSFKKWNVTNQEESFQPIPPQKVFYRSPCKNIYTICYIIYPSTLFFIEIHKLRVKTPIAPRKS